MKRFCLIAICLCPAYALQALDRGAAHSPAAGFETVAAVDPGLRHQTAASPETGTVQGLWLEAELIDREGRRWGLQWKLLGDAADNTLTAGTGLWRAGVVLTLPDGRVHERIFAGDAGPSQRLAVVDDWEWRSQGGSLLPAKLRFDVDGRELMLLVESLPTSATGGASPGSRVRVRGFANLGLEKTYLSGHGRLQRDWQQVAGHRSPDTRPNLAVQLPATE